MSCNRKTSHEPGNMGDRMNAPSFNQIRSNQWQRSLLIRTKPDQPEYKNFSLSSVVQRRIHCSEQRLWTKSFRSDSGVASIHFDVSSVDETGVPGKIFQYLNNIQSF